jgi:hypothetical protein
MYYIPFQALKDYHMLTAAQVYYVTKIYPEHVTDAEASTTYKTMLEVFEDGAIREGTSSFWQTAANVLNNLFRGVMPSADALPNTVGNDLAALQATQLPGHPAIAAAILDYYTDIKSDIDGQISEHDCDLADDEAQYIAGLKAARSYLQNRAVVRGLIPGEGVAPSKDQVEFDKLWCGDRFVAFGALWTKLDADTARKHSAASRGLQMRGVGYIGDAVCSFNPSDIVVFVPPAVVPGEPHS